MDVEFCSIDEFETILNYMFQCWELVFEVLMYVSYSNEHWDIYYDNEWFEFLGDVVLGMIVSICFLLKYFDEFEGVLFCYKVVLVSE